jgi:glucose-6-phosphate-specific signal transduction histidine kinase
LVGQAERALLGWISEDIAIAIFTDLGGVLLTNGWDRHMRERAARLGGQLNISSAATVGTEIRLSISGDVAFQLA